MHGFVEEQGLDVMLSFNALVPAESLNVISQSVSIKSQNWLSYTSALFASHVDG